MIKKLRLPLLVGLLGLCLISLGLDFSSKVDAGQNYYLGAAAADGFIVQGIAFDGLTDYLLRGAGLTGAVDGKAGTLTVWVDPGDAAVGTFLKSATGAAGGIIFSRAVVDIKVKLLGLTAGGGFGFNISSANEITAAGGWYHILASWDLATTTIQMYIDDGSDIAIANNVNSTIDYTQTDWGVGATDIGTNLFAGGIAELWFHTVRFDLSVEANRRFWRTADGKPEDLGSDGSEPGVQPLIYLSSRSGDAAATFVNNKGSGGNFVDQGSIAVAGTSPSD